MTRPNSLRLLTLAGLVSAAVVASADPRLLLPNQQITVLPQTNVLSSLGTEIYTVTNPFYGRDNLGKTAFTGMLSSQVFRGSDGTLSFVYTASNNLSSQDAIERITVTSYGEFNTTVEQGVPGGTSVAASGASRSANGTVVGFNFTPGSANGAITPGLSGRRLVIHTDATEFNVGSAQFISGGVATAQAFVPTAVPEPATMAGLALGGLALLRRRKRA